MMTGEKRQKKKNRNRFLPQRAPENKKRSWKLLLTVLFCLIAVILRLLIPGEPEAGAPAGQEVVSQEDAPAGQEVISEEGAPAGQELIQEVLPAAASRASCISDPASIPEYSGKDCIILGGGIPNFTAEELESFTGQYYSELDSLGRCSSAFACLHRSLYPEGPRERVTDIRPTGWVQKKYEKLIDTDPPYLYNRCHLIAYAMTGQNANEKNLITGTRHMNADLMQEWELKVLKYLDECENHVLYRVTPFFQGKEKLARGVEMEAYSEEDAGQGVCFHVFVYNVQPGVEIDYNTGNSWLSR